MKMNALLAQNGEWECSRVWKQRTLPDEMLHFANINRIYLIHEIWLIRLTFHLNDFLGGSW